MKNKGLLFLILFLTALFSAEEIEAQQVVHPNVIKKPLGFAITKSLRDTPVISEFEKKEEEFFFTSMSTNMTKGGSYSITIYPAWAGTVYSEGYSVWIDYNQNGDFTDAGEQVFTNAKTTATSVSGSFTVPTSALTGTTGMRVSMQYNTIPVSCGNFDYGEVEDYTVNIAAKSLNVTSSKLYIYPNPANDVITVYVRGLDGKSNVRIYSITGSLVKEIQVSDIKNEINISDLPSGIYAIRIISDGEILAGKFIKQ